MIALHESLVEWTVLALGLAVAAALLVRLRGAVLRPQGREPCWPRLWLPGVALAVIVANAGIAVNAAAAARSEAAGAWGLWHVSAVWGPVRGASSSAAGAVAASASTAGNVAAAMDSVVGQHAGSGAAAVRLGAIAAAACLAVLLAAWLYLSRSLRVLPSDARDEDEVECCADCPQCMEAVPPPVDSTNRRRARGLTMTRLGGG